MYSVVLATMLTAGSTTTPSWGCHGCHGCRSCHGCHSCHGCRSCHGCSGCSGCMGCYGSCAGCSGCYGSCAGGSGCYGCMGYGCYGWATAYGCYGYLGCGGGYGGGVAMGPTFSGSVPTYASSAPVKSGAPAKVVVQMPSDAKLYADGRPVDATGGSFTTPNLNLGENYEYTLKAEIVQGGRTLIESKTVRVRGGQTTTVAFDNLRAPGRDLNRAAEASAHINVSLPAKARLYVNDVLWPTRSFDTPVLVKDKSYTYSLRAELDVNGQTVTQAKKVNFQGGQTLTVEFETLIAAEATARK